MPTDDRSALRRLVTILVVIFVVAALKATKPLTLPLAFALFAVVLFWPLYRWLNHRAPSGIALLGVLLALLGVFAVFFGTVSFAVEEVVEGAPAYEQRFEELQTRATAILGSIGLGEASEQRAATESDGSEGFLTSERLASLVERVARDLWSVVAYLVLITALFALAIVEVPRWRHKLRTRFDDPVSAEALATTTEVTTQVQRFLLVQSFTSVITGVLTALLCWAFGVDFAFLWGLLAFLLNFIPTLGSIVAVVPPTLFALLQFGLGWKAPAVFVGLAAIQVILGSYVDPKLQGRYLELSAFVVLLAITFWTWVWGIPGAFIAVPITAALVLVAEHVGPEWVARLLTRDDANRYSLPSKPNS